MRDWFVLVWVQNGWTARTINDKMQRRSGFTR